MSSRNLEYECIWIKLFKSSLYDKVAYEIFVTWIFRELILLILQIPYFALNWCSGPNDLYTVLPHWKTMV